MPKPNPYARPHRAERNRWKPTVAAGDAYCSEIVCLMASRWIPPGSAWDLAHDRSTGGYLGPAHARCNRAEGGRERHRRARRAPTRWDL